MIWTDETIAAMKADAEKCNERMYDSFGPGAQRGWPSKRKRAPKAETERKTPRLYADSAKAKIARLPLHAPTAASDIAKIVGCNVSTAQKAVVSLAAKGVLVMDGYGPQLKNGMRARLYRRADQR